MGRVTGSFPSLINGVSQQPAAIRLPSQGEAQVNAYSTVARGLIRRPPTEMVCKIADSYADDAFVHIINRDAGERYVCVVDTTLATTSPNVLTTAESECTGGWVASTGVTDTSVPHADTVDNASVDGKSNYRRLTFDGVAGRSYTLSNFATLTANESHTFSVWLRLKTNTTLTDVDNRIEMSGADLTGTQSQAINTLVYNVWTKVEVTATAAASPTGAAITIGLYCDEAVDIDIYGAQVEEAAASTTTVVKGTKPQLRIFDFTGVEQQVWIPDGQAYILDQADPSTTIKALTVADYTFFVNNTVTVEADTTTSASRPYEALISFGTIQPGSTVDVYINGTQEATLLISDTDPSDLETNYVAEQIRSQLAAGGFNTSPWSVSLTESEGSVIYLSNSTTDFDITVRDGSNGLGIKIIKQKIQYFEDLPRQGKNDFVIEIAGDPVTGFGNYWVKFDGDNDGIATWSETIEPGIITSLKASTMPHTMTRNRSSTFTFKEQVYDPRAVGDAESNPMPTLVGETINDVFFHKSRLSFLAGEGIVMSEAGQFFNFFRTTVTTLVDGDPIDVGTNHTKVSILRHAIPYQEQLLLFSDQTQFRLTQGDILSPSTVGIEPITEYESSIEAKPAAVGNFVFFAVEKSNYASLREYYVADDTQRNDAREITGHVPSYIPAGIVAIKGSSNEDFLIVKTTGDTTNLYVYKYFWSGNEKIQSSWSRWNFPDVTKVLGFDFIRSTLYMVVKRADGVFFEKIELDVGNEDSSGTGYNLGLDRKIFSTNAGVSAVYDAGTDRTTYTFADMTWKSVPDVVGITGNTVAPPGFRVDIVGSPTTYDANTIVVEGDTTAEDFMFGIPYETSYELSDIVPRFPSSNGGEVPFTEGRMQVFWINFRYAFTGYMQVEVEVQGRDTKTYEFNARVLSSAAIPLGQIPISEAGNFRVPVFSKNNRVNIRIKSSEFLPMRIISADWTGNLIQKFRRV